MSNARPIKVLISVIGLDGHFTGAEIVSRFLMDAGMEVVYLGIYQTPEMIVNAAAEESVDVIGISSHASNYEQIGMLIDLMKKKGLKDVPVIVGGSVPEKHAAALTEKGVSKIFLPHATSESIINYITSNVKR
jgi:methylmalonyl-CoA mutase C-terminal domain/subunit